MAEFLRHLDVVYFNLRALNDHYASAIRQSFAERLMKTYAWRSHSDVSRDGIEVHSAPAIATLFFNDFYPFSQQPPRCYLHADAAARIHPFVPVIEALIREGPSRFVAQLTMNLLEVSPKPALLRLLLLALQTWLAHRKDTHFWIDDVIGRRACKWLEGILQSKSDVHALDTTVRRELDQYVSALVTIGVPAATDVEKLLAR